MSEIAEFDDVRLKAETEKAGLFVIDEEEFWIPWSQVDYWNPESGTKTGSLGITDWIAEKLGL